MTLLQNILNSPPVPSRHPAECDFMYRDLISSLPWVETLVFHENVADIVRDEMTAGHIHRPDYFRLKDIHIPYNDFWIEYPEVGFREGYLVGKADNAIHLLLAVSVPTEGKSAWMPILSGKFGVDDRFQVSFDNLQVPPANDPDFEARLVWSIGSLLHTLFTLTVPRMTSIITVSPSATVNKARQKKGRYPVIEYKKVVVNLMKPANVYPHNNTVPSNIHKRLHQVQGHIRTLVGTTLQGAPRHTWISPHWRGDPHLGVIIHDKTIQT